MSDLPDGFTLSERVDRHLGRIYTGLGADDRAALSDRVIEAAGADPAASVSAGAGLPSQDEVMLITYGDSVRDVDRTGLEALQGLLETRLAGVFSAVHVLPFFESSSDGGFSVVDYRRIADGVGTWHDIESLAAERAVMVDLVCNHGSAQSEWFAGFRRGEHPHRDWYVTAEPTDDLSSVVRPRTHPLLLDVETPDGPRHVWATFSHDQVDFDFANPDVLVEFCSIIGFYLDRGASRVRLDAIAYLWKELGTPCVHLPQTHEVVKLMRTLTAARPVPPLLITETNVPHAQNISYFGEGDEAHLVYNFTLAPLIVWSALAGSGAEMTGWLGRLEPPPDGCTFLNFIASHDGIGLRPIEDLVPTDDLQVLLDRAGETGGAWSLYSAPGGPRPYELNVSLADLLAGPDGTFADRFVVAHALMLAVQGVPAIYLHSMLSTPGDVDAVERTGHRRDINRVQLDRSLIDERLDTGWRADVFDRLAHLIGVRRRTAAFAPTADQVVHVIDERVVALERRAAHGRIFAVHNMSGDPVVVEPPAWAGARDLISGTSRGAHVELAPWQAVWLSD